MFSLEKGKCFVFDVCICVHMCEYTHIHTCRPTYKHTNIHTYIHTYTHTYVRTYIHIYTPVQPPQHQPAWDAVSFIDDNTSTLQKMAGDLRLARQVNLHFASWGRSTPKNKATVAAWPRVRTLSVDGFVDLLLQKEKL